MKLNKRIKNAILQGFILNIIISLIFLYILFYVSIPGFKKYEEDKNKLTNILTEKEQVEKKGIDFTKFKTLQKSLKKDNYTLFILNKLNQNFYNQYFINKGKDNFNDFIKQKTIEINKEFEEGSYSKKMEQINKVLPTYTSLGKSVNGVLTDLLFVNYIENLFYIFNLEIDSYFIGIPKLVKEENYSNTKKKGKKDLVNTEIYSIPMKYTFSGRKADILDFIHFINNVGKIEIEDNKISFPTDNFIKKRTTIYGTKKDKDYNIYKNQIMDIESIKMEEYLDSSLGLVSGENIPTETEKYLNYLKQTQGREEFEVTLAFNFYVKGIPSYEVIRILKGDKNGEENIIEGIIPKKERLLKKVEADYKKSQQLLNKNKSSNIIAIINKLESIKEILTVMGKELKKLDLNISKTGVDIDLYNKIMDYDNKLNYIELLIKKETEEIDTINTKIN